MIDKVYNAKILEFAGNISHIGALEDADAEAIAHSKLCGSKVKIWLKLSDGKVSDFGHDVKACALGQATSSIMAKHIIGSTPDELRVVRDQMWAMLKENGTPPVGRFEDLKYLEPVKEYRARHASTMLTFDAVVDALDQIEQAKVAV
ncbi:MAG: iron-sulfur cluster assembly scaffold protein [Lentilitoribacter sp.]